MTEETAHKTVATIREWLQKGYFVQIGTLPSAYILKQGDADKVKATETGLHLQVGNAWVCINDRDIVGLA